MIKMRPQPHNSRCKQRVDESRDMRRFPIQLLAQQFLTVSLKVQLFKDKEGQVYNIKSLFS